jgi:hypothetical protein
MALRLISPDTNPNCIQRIQISLSGGIIQTVPPIDDPVYINPLRPADSMADTCDCIPVYYVKSLVESPNIIPFEKLCDPEYPD